MIGQPLNQVSAYQYYTLGKIAWRKVEKAIVLQYYGYFFGDVCCNAGVQLKKHIKPAR